MKTLKKAILLIFVLALSAIAQAAEPMTTASPDSTADTLAPRVRPEEPMTTGLEIGKSGDDVYIAGDRVGIGVNPPTVKLDVNGSTQASAFGQSNNGLKLFAPGGASFATSTASITGAIKIRLPQYRSSTMMRMTVKIYQYSTNQSYTIDLGGYNYSSGSWYNTFANIYTTSGPNLAVRFGHDGARNCIWIGETSSTWAYPQVFVTDFQAGYSNYGFDQWDDGWSVSFVSAFETVEATATSGYLPSGSGSSNYLAKWTGPSSLGNSSIYDNGTNLGIGTTSPGAALHLYQDRYTLYGPNSSWGAYLQVGGNGRVTTNASVAATNGNLHIDAANGAYATYINYYSANNTYINAAGGNVGIGTSGPSFKTTVSQDMTMSGDINPGSAQLSVEGVSAPSKRMVLGYDTNSNGFGYIKAGNYGVTWTNLALQPSGGNVGIGRTDPQQKLEVLGTARITSTSYPGPSGDYRYIDIYSSLANYIDASNDLYIRPKGGLILQPGYPTSGTGNIQIKDGGANVYGTFYGGSRVLDMTGNAGGLRLGAHNWSDAGTSYGHIVSDNGSYKALMIVGNNITGNSGRGREVKVWDYLNVQGAFNVTGQFVGVGNTSVVSNLNADLLDGLHASSFDQSNSNEIQNLNSVLSTGNSAGGQNIVGVGDIQCTQDYGLGLVGVYSDVRYQNVFAMGTAYRLAANGTTTGNLYGIAWTHSNIGGQSISGLGHQMLIMSNGTTRSAIGDGIWTNYSVQANANITAGAEIYVGNWVRHSDNDGTYWSNTGWHVYPKDASDMYFRTGSGNGGICGTVADATARGYIHWTTSNEIGFLDNTRGWQLRCWDGGTEIYDITYMNDARAYIFYDRGNTAYYLNPDGYSNLSDIGWGNSGTRTQTRDNAGLRGDAGARSGFFETVSPTNYYTGASSWQHLIDVRHSNNGNNYAMQFAGSFFDQRLFFRKTNDNAAQAWSQIPVSSTGSIYAYTTTTIYSDANVDIQWNASYYQPQFQQKTGGYWWDVTWNVQNGSGTQYRDGDDIATSSYTWYYFYNEGALNTSLNLGSGSSYGSDGTYWLGYESDYGTGASSAYKIELFRRGSAVTYTVTRYH